MRTAYVITNSAGNPFAIGYGSPLFNNSGCNTELATNAPNVTTTNFPNAGSGCAGDIHQIIEGTLGFWHKLYQGSKGRVQWGMQYSYFAKYGWSGNNTTASSFTAAAGTGAGGSQRPKAVDNMVWTAFRYYIP